jgi:hypothetical protein
MGETGLASLAGIHYLDIPLLHRNNIWLLLDVEMMIILCDGHNQGIYARNAEEGQRSRSENKRTFESAECTAGRALVVVHGHCQTSAPLEEVATSQSADTRRSVKDELVVISRPIADLPVATVIDGEDDDDDMFERSRQSPLPSTIGPAF